MYNEALKQSVIDNTQFYNDMQRKIGSLSETVESESEVNTGNTFLNYVMPLLDKFLPLIIGGKKTSNETINNFKHIPQVDAILKDKDKLKILLDNIKKTKGLATYNRVVRALQENKIL
jgi:3-methyladenine DNA glycosylase Tag